MCFENMDAPVVQKYRDLLVISLVHSSFMLFRNCHEGSCLLRVKEVWCMPLQVSGFLKFLVVGFSPCLKKIWF